MFCTKCGTENNDDSLFCCKCGNSLQQNSGAEDIVKRSNRDSGIKQLHSANILSSVAFCLSIVFTVVSSILYYCVFSSNGSFEPRTIISFFGFIILSFVLSTVLFAIGKKICKSDDRATKIKIAKLYRVLAIIVACFSFLVGFYFVVLTCGAGFFYLAASILHIIAGVRFVAGAKLYESV